MQKDASIQNHVPETEGNARGTAEDEGINDPGVCCEFPQEQESKKDGGAGETDDLPAAALFVQVIELALGKFIHWDLTPSI